MNYKQEKTRYISYCGAYCYLCDWFTDRHRKVFQTALDSIELYGFKRWLQGRVDIKNLKLGLKILANSNICSGCKAEAGSPNDRCKIRKCAYSKGLELCSECDNFPCSLLKTNKGVVKFHCLENLQEIKTKGLKRWIDQQWQEYINNELY